MHALIKVNKVTILNVIIIQKLNRWIKITRKKISLSKASSILDRWLVLMRVKLNREKFGLIIIIIIIIII